jgi:hypothetical protein
MDWLLAHDPAILPPIRLKFSLINFQVAHDR